MAWARSPETWLLILSQMLNSFITGVKCHQGIRTLGKSEITNGFLWGLKEHTEHQFQWKNCCPGGCDCVMYVERILKFCGNPREKFWFMWLDRCSTDTPPFHVPCSLLLSYCSSYAWNHTGPAGASELWDLKRDEGKRPPLPWWVCKC